MISELRASSGSSPPRRRWRSSATRYAVARLVHHVVTQVVEAVFVVRAVGDVSSCMPAALFARQIGRVDAHRQAEEVIEARAMVVASRLTR